MTPTPPCACGHLATLHMPHGGGGRCTGAGCDCRSYVRRTTLPDELLRIPADSCVHCGGSGVLNVEASYDLSAWTAQASACHCPAGRTWEEAGLAD